VSASIVRTDSVRTPKRNPAGLGGQCIEKRGGEPFKKGFQTATRSTAVADDSNLSPTRGAVGNLRNEGNGLHERNKFLEDELDAIGQMIDMLIMEVPRGVGASETTATECSQEAPLMLQEE
jgi:hypothetical protein